MINSDDVIKENINEKNPNWSRIPDRPYRILIIADPGSGKTNLLFNLINQQPYIDLNHKFTYMLKIHLKQNTNS